MAGAAWATTLSYLLCFGYILWFFMSENSELKINLSHFNLSKKITSEIASLGSVTLARQAVVSVIYLFMNNILFDIGGESSVAVFGIISRVMMFALFPVLGITQGFLPIAGYNYGARSYARVKETINTSVLYASGLAIVIFIFLMVFTEQIVSVFTKDSTVIDQTVYAMKWVFLAVPIVSVQLIGSAYFQAIGKAIPALLLTLSRQGFFFLPLVLILPYFYGEFGVWISFALADFLSTILTAYFINREVRLKLNTISG
jgi:Na+-driven multidrug efflux pump